MKSMDDFMKETSTPQISEESWLSHFQSLHSNEPLNSHQEAIIDELTRLEEATTQSHALDYLITELEIQRQNTEKICKLHEFLLFSCSIVCFSRFSSSFWPLFLSPPFLKKKKTKMCGTRDFHTPFFSGVFCTFTARCF